MSKELKYYHLLNRVTVNALLHLWLNAALSRRFIPTNKRNEILIKFLKPQMALSKNLAIKKDLKTLILAGRSKGADIEKSLCDVNAMNEDYRSRFTDVDRWYLLMTYLFESYGWGSSFLDAEKPLQVNVIYIDKAVIKLSFSRQDQQVKPIELKMVTNTPEKILAAIDRYDGYTSTQNGDSKDGVYSFLLHCTGPRLP